jgi:hypothetical protein
MSSVDSVGQFTADSFSNVRIGVVKGAVLNTVTANAYVIPILSGGLTNSGVSAANSGGVIVRRVTVQNPSGTVASANITIGVTSGGNTIVANANGLLGNVSAVGTFQDMTTATTYVSGYTTQCLYVNVNAASGNNNTCDITVWGDVVSF